MAEEPTMRRPHRPSRIMHQESRAPGDANAGLSDMHRASAAAEPQTARTTQLVAANEHLVVTALRAQSAADVATLALQALSRSSELDCLTDLPNRQSLLSRFKYAIAIAGRTGTQLALLFVDLNNFKQINDTLGHPVGDQVLRLAAKRLATAVRESDTVSRHGGDEFLILLTDVSHATDAVQVATKLISAMGRPARVGEHVLRLTASIGISLFPRDGEDSDTLIQRADAAMYRAKRNGEGGFAFYGTSSDEEQAVSPRLSALHHPLSHYRAALSEQARRHSQLRDANEQLVFAALSAQQLQGAAEQAQRRQTEFLALLAHELRNPLMPIQYAAKLLHRALRDESLLPRIQAMIERQVAHMSRLIGDLLDVSRVSTGKLRVERRLLNLKDVLEAAVESCRPSLDARLQHFTVNIPAGPLDVYGDAVRLAQVFSNLLDNASKYSAENADIALSALMRESSIEIKVSDMGIGMSPEVLATIFEPFVQDAAAIEFNGTGLGIGLTVVRELVAAHEGTIVAHSAGVTLGSSFVVTLPRAPPTSITPDTVSNLENEVRGATQ
jgi:diguanylate cyclase